MPEQPSADTVIKYSAAGKNKAAVTVTFPDGTSHTDTVNMASAAKRAAFVAKIKERWEGVPAEELEAQMERIAAEVCGGDGGGEEGTQRDRIVRLARERYRFGRTDADEPFAVPIAGPNVARMLRASRSSLRAELARAYCEAYEKAPGSSGLADAMLVLEGDALAAEPEPVHLRLARLGDAIVLDLGDTAGRAVVAGPAGWEVVDKSPVLFRRTALTSALPAPVRGGSLEPLRAMVNVAGTAWPLALGWLVACLIPDIEHPIVLLGGQQDAGKSTTGRCLGGLIDPSPAALRCPPRDLEQWAVAAVGSWIVVIDNISGIAEWLSDAFCRAVTGDGLVKRSLFTDGDLSLLVFQRCLILTSIDAGGLKGDLGRRMVMLELEPIGKKRKRPPKLLKAEFEKARPAILGALLDLLCPVLRELPSVHLEEFQGLADFEQVLAAMDKVTGTAALEQYHAQWSRIAADVVESDNVAVAIRSFIDEEFPTGEWSGTASDLLEAIAPEHPPKGWPTNPRRFAGMVRRLIPVLLEVGVEVVPPSSTDKQRTYRLSKTALTAQPPENGDGDAPGPQSPAGGSETQPPSGTPDRPEPRPSGGAVADRPGDRPTDRPTDRPAPPPATEPESGPLGGVGDPKPKRSARKQYGPEWGVL